MKKIVASFAAFLLLFSVPTLFAQIPVPMTGAVMPAGLERIGVVAAAGGKVELTTPGQVGRIAQSGQAIFMGDEVKTDAKGHLQILLLDETVFTIGPDSAIIIDKFVYDPKSHAGEIKASISKGVFRYVSGKIAAKNPDSVKVKLPTATIGFRGTIVGGSVGADGQALTGLLGPGDNNDSGAQVGSFTVDGAGGDHQDVNRTGFGVEVGADGGVSNVFQLSDAQINGLTSGLGGGQGGGGGAGGEGDGEGGGLGGDTDMGSLSGEDGAIAGDNVSFTDGLGGITDSLNSVSTLGAQEAAHNSASGSTTIDNKTTYEQLRASTQSPSVNQYFNYHNSGSYSGGSGGSFSATIVIDFGSVGSIGGGSSSVAVDDGLGGGVNSNDSANLGLSAQNFPGSGPATFTWDVLGAAFSTNTFHVEVTLENSGEVTAQTATINVTYTNTGSGGPEGGSGTVTTELIQTPVP